MTGGLVVAGVHLLVSSVAAWVPLVTMASFGFSGRLAGRLYRRFRGG